jgi:hypothetical protein
MRRREAPTVIRRVNPRSVAKVSGVLGALLGLVIGAAARRVGGIEIDAA